MEYLITEVHNRSKHK